MPFGHQGIRQRLLVAHYIWPERRNRLLNFWEPEPGERDDKASHSALIAVKPVYGWPRNRRSRVADLRTVQFGDLLRRDKRRVLDPSVATMLTGARVLVTGAGGSIGQELCRQIRGHDPACLYMLDYDESNMHTLQLELYGQALLDSSGVIIADVRDEARIQQVLSFTRPDVVFHIAAHKHLPLLERRPCEAVKSNILGIRNVLREAAEHDAARLVLSCTHKAADPQSILGAGAGRDDRAGARRQHDALLLGVVRERHGQPRFFAGSHRPAGRAG